MDCQLYRLIRLNEKKRQYRDGLNINPEEFSMFDIVDEDPLHTIDVEPVSYSRKRDENGRRNSGHQDR